MNPPATRSGTSGSGTMKSMGTKTSCSGTAKPLPTSKLTFDTTAYRTTSVPITSGSAERIGSTKTRIAAAASTKPSASMPLTSSSRRERGFGRRSRAASTRPTDKSTLAHSARAYRCPSKQPLLRTFVHVKLHAGMEPFARTLRRVKAEEIRETYLAFFEARDHRRVPSASLVPPSYDPSVLLTTAGMQPFKPYFRGDEQPPHVRLTSCQKVFRTTDIENVGLTARHLTFFEMLGNFSFGDYFKEGAAEAAWELSTNGFGFDPERIWITVFGGDEELGLGPDDEAIACWHAIGVPDERIVRLG